MLLRTTGSRSTIRSSPLLILLIVAGALAGYFGTSRTSFAQEQTTSIHFSNFNSVARLNLVGSAAAVGSVLRLTSTETCCQGGAIWYAPRQSVTLGFQTSFQFRIHDIRSGGGDGFAFV